MRKKLECVIELDLRTFHEIVGIKIVIFHNTFIQHKKMEYIVLN